MRPAAIAIAHAALAFCLAAAVPAGAQEPVSTFSDLAARLKQGDRVSVTDAAGRQHEGRIQRLAADTLTLGNGTPTILSAGDVRLVTLRQRDSLKNGTLIGLGIGGGLAAVWCIGAVAVEDEYDEISPGVECAEGMIVFGGLGTLIGLGIDAARSGKPVVVYRAPVSGGSPHARITVAPFITRRARGVAVSFSF